MQLASFQIQFASVSCLSIAKFVNLGNFTAGNYEQWAAAGQGC